MKNKLHSMWTSRIAPFLKRLFLDHWGTKLLSLVFAVILWNYAVLNLQTTRNVVISNVPLTVSGSVTLRQRNLALSRSVEEIVKDVRVTVSTPLSTAGSVSRDRISVAFDLSSISTAGTHTLPITARTTYGTVTSVYPNSITVEVEDLHTREFPVTVLPSGSAAKGCTVGTAATSAQTVNVTGPVALLETVEQVVARVPLNKAHDDIKSSVRLELLDGQGLTVTSSLLSMDRSDVIVTIPIRHSQEFPILTEGFLIGENQIAEGHIITSIDVYPQTLEVEGTSQAIASLQVAGGLTLSQCDVTGASSDIRTYATVYLPSGATLTQNRSILVIVRIEQEMATVTLENVPVELRGVGDGLRGQMNIGTVDVTLNGPKASLDHLPAGHVQLYVDATDRSAGSFTAPIYVLIDDRYEADITLSSEVATVTLTEVLPEE